MHAAPHAAPAACENCSTALQGGYCHVCGQHAINPTRHFAHAVEEVFESFWHLDGRVFRTVRDLFIPGRVARNYLDGHRVRYIAPLRLFVILTVLTFFVGQLAAMVGAPSKGDDAGTAGGAVVVDAGKGSGNSIERAATEVEVNAELARQLAELEEARAAVKAVPFAGAGIDEAEKEIRAVASRRIAQLRASHPVAASGAPAAAAAAPASAKPVPPPAPQGDDASEARENIQKMAAKMGRLRDPKAVWHERDNPVDVASLAPFADRWLNHRLANMQHNVERVSREGVGMMFKLALAAVPPALFVLVPVFALLLRLLYVLTPRGYLEHLVVALYSHAFMLVVLLTTFALIMLRAAVGGPVVTTLSYIVQTGLWLALPVYLFVMQHRVYREYWAITFGKYLVLGIAYMVMVGLVAAYSAFAGITSGA